MTDYSMQVREAGLTFQASDIVYLAYANHEKSSYGNTIYRRLLERTVIQNSHLRS